MVTCIIVDDEAAARTVLVEYINKTPALELVGSFSNPLEAIDFMQKTSVALLFLDINMPDISGLQLPALLPERPSVIYTTAYSEYAVQSYELSAIDYLLKPISFERFTKAVGKVQHQSLSDKARQPKAGKTLYVKSGSKFHQLKIHDIAFLEKDGHYIIIHTGHKKVISRFTVKQLLKSLPKEEFIQIHKSYVIALRKIDVFDGQLVKIGVNNLPLGQTYKKAFLERLKNYKTIGS